MTVQDDRMVAAWESLLVTLGGPPVALADGAPQALVRTVPGMVPVTVLGGFLGAGKTTLLCSLLDRTSAEIVALVNDFAAINLDAARVRASNAETIEFQNGCACCVLGSDLEATLQSIAARPVPPQAIVIEASGIADPSRIAQTVANASHVTLDGIVTVVDAKSCWARVSDPFTGPLFARQLAAAHLVVLTKTANCGDLAQLRQRVGELAPGRAVLVADQLLDKGDAAVSVLLGAATRGAGLPVAVEDHDYAGFAAATVALPGAVVPGRFFELLDQLPEAVYRMKGFVRFTQPVSISADAPTPRRAARVELQSAGSHWRLTAAGDDHNLPEQANGLVIIGRRADANFDRFVAALQRVGSSLSD